MNDRDRKLSSGLIIWWSNGGGNVWSFDDRRTEVRQPTGLNSDWWESEGKEWKLKCQIKESLNNLVVEINSEDYCIFYFECSLKKYKYSHVYFYFRENLSTLSKYIDYHPTVSAYTNHRKTNFFSDIFFWSRLLKLKILEIRFFFFVLFC